MIFDLAKTRPDEIVLDDFTRRRTRAEMVDRVFRGASLLRDELGLAPGERAALMMGNRAEVFELTLSALIAGVWLVPINWHLKRDEVDYIIANSGARAVFTDETYQDFFAASGSAGAALKDANPSGVAPIFNAGDSLDAALATASDRPPDWQGPAGGAMIYTSGTTGRPKGVKRGGGAPIDATLDNMIAYGRLLGLDGQGSHLVTGPAYHAAPLLFTIYDLVAGASCLSMPRWDDAGALRLIDEHAVRHVHLVPTMFVRLLRLPEETRRAFDGSSLSVVLHGAAPVGREVKRRMIEWWGKILVEYWGATESGVCTLATSDEWLAHPGTVGRCTPNYEVFSVDDEGQRLPVGEDGHLYCRHKTVDRIFEYHEDPEKTEAAYLEPSVFTIGDVGRVDEEGFVYLSDRKANMIVSGGVNIYPAEIEHVLQEHPAVADVGVFGIPNEEWGESVKAAVELLDGFTASPELEAEILAFGRERLADYKVPRSIDFEESLPRHTTGKLYIRLLRDRYWKGHDGAI